MSDGNVMEKPYDEMTSAERRLATATNWRFRVEHMTREERRQRAEILWHLRREVAYAVRMGWSGGATMEGVVDGRAFSLRLCPPAKPLTDRERKSAGRAQAFGKS